MITGNEYLKFNILIADDEPALCKAMNAYLQNLDAKVQIVTANSGTDAMRKLRLQDFDLVILDNIMPKATGKQVVEFMRTTERLKFGHIPIIFISGSLYEADLQSVVRLGVKHILVKPFQGPQLIEKVAEALGLELKKRLRSVDDEAS